MLPYSFLFVTKQKQIQFWKTKLAAYKLMSTLPFSLFLTVFFPSNRSLAVLQLVLSQVTRAKPAFECCIQETVGHVLAQDVVATTAIPDKPLSIKVRVSCVCVCEGVQALGFRYFILGFSLYLIVCFVEIELCCVVFLQDGFAIKAGDKSRFFSVVGENRAGNVDESIEVVTGAVCYVTTGSPIPKGADAVVMIEDTTQGVEEEDHKQVRKGLDNHSPPFASFFSFSSSSF